MLLQAQAKFYGKRKIQASGKMVSKSGNMKKGIEESRLEESRLQWKRIYKII